MQTILGAGGQIATELARELHDRFGVPLRLVSRHPRAVHPSDEVFAADLTDPAQTDAAVAGSDIAYLTAGLPTDAKHWVEKFPAIMRNAIDACARHGAKLVFFDNTYMYPMTSEPLTEAAPFDPQGPRAKVRAEIATMLLDAMAAGRVEAVICRAPEFYGPAQTQSFTNALLLGPIARGERDRVPLRDDTLRSLIWTPDASRAMALIGNTPAAFGQTWHLPCDPERRTYAQLAALASDLWGVEARYTVAPAIAFRAAAVFDKGARTIVELLPRYAHDNIFVTEKFAQAFPEFRVTGYPEGVAALRPTG